MYGNMDRSQSKIVKLFIKGKQIVTEPPDKENVLPKWPLIL